MATKLDKTQRTELLGPILQNGWSLDKSSKDAINRQFLFNAFNEAIAFMIEIATKAGQIDHRPELLMVNSDWNNVYNMVEITLSTCDCGGLSQRDVTLANFIDSVYARVSGGQRSSKEGTATIVFSAEKLRDKDQCAGKSDPFFRMLKESADGTVKHNDGQWTIAHTSETIKNKDNPKWKPFGIRISKEDYEKRVKIRVYDRDPDEVDEIGRPIVVQIKELKAGTVFQLPNNCGKLRVERFDVVDSQTFCQ